MGGGVTCRQFALSSTIAVPRFGTFRQHSSICGALGKDFLAAILVYRSAMPGMCKSLHINLQRDDRSIFHR
jgi:hypothetical protein